ncbi:MAG TPA: LamG domain-containing protein [Candidatus Brocadiia bacterium]|nr:LamG domain-containing protein [Candidatus Brocadiia bacterium]
MESRFHKILLPFLFAALATVLQNPTARAADPYLAIYEFDENDGQILSDSIGHNHGYLGARSAQDEYDAVRTQAGNYYGWWDGCGALCLGNPEAKRVAVIPDSGLRWSQTALTVEFWFRLRKTDGSGQRVIVRKARRGDRRSTDSFAVYHDVARGALVFQTVSASGRPARLTWRPSSGTLDQTGQWHHMAFVFDGSADAMKSEKADTAPMRFYLDGEARQCRLTGLSPREPHKLSFDSSPIVIGALLENDGSVTEPAFGDIDDLRISAVARRPEELGFRLNPGGSSRPELQIVLEKRGTVLNVYEDSPVSLQFLSTAPAAASFDVSYSLTTDDGRVIQKKEGTRIKVPGGGESRMDLDNLPKGNGLCRFRVLVSREGRDVMRMATAIARIPRPLEPDDSWPWAAGLKYFTPGNVMLMRDLGICRLIETSTVWNSVEPSPGQRSEIAVQEKTIRAGEAGLRIHWVLGGGVMIRENELPMRSAPSLSEWDAYVGRYVTLTRSASAMYQFWHMPNTKLGWERSPSEYARLYYAGARCAIRFNATSRMMPGVLNDFDIEFADALYRSGCGHFIHAIGIHPQESDPEEYDASSLDDSAKAALESARRPGEKYRALFRLMREVCARNGYKPAPIHIMDCAYGEETQAVEKRVPYTFRRMILSLAAGAAIVSPGKLDAPEAGFIADGLPTRAYVRLAFLTRNLSMAQYVGDLDLGKDVCAILFKRPGNWIMAVWNCEDRDGSISLPEAAGEFAALDADGNPLPPGEGGKYPIGSYPIYFTGKNLDILALASPVDTAMTIEPKTQAPDPPEAFLSMDVCEEITRGEAMKRGFIPAEIGVFNDSPNRLMGTLVFTAPENWAAVPGKRPVDIVPGKNAIFQFTIHCPAVLDQSDILLNAEVRGANVTVKPQTVEIHIADQLHIKDWSIIGPFPNAGCKGFDLPYPPESELKKDAVYDGATGKVRWANVPAHKLFAPGLPNFCRLDGLFKPTDEVVAYLACVIMSPSARDVAFRLGSDDGVVLWLNGREILRRHEHRGAEPDQERVKASLASGPNILLVKLEDYVGDWGIILGIDPGRELKTRPLFEEEP